MYRMKAQSKVVFLVFLLASKVHATTPLCIESEAALAIKPNGAARVTHLYDALQNPEQVLNVRLATLSTDLGKQLTPGELNALTATFHDYLLAAKGNGEKPNAFAADNVNHVALHYRDLEKHRAEIDALFRAPGDTHAPTDVALLNAAAHDIGKIAELVGMVSPDVLQTYNAAVADAGPQAFLLKTILGHDGLTMDGIANAVKKFGAEKHWSAEKTSEVTKLLQAASARHNAGYDKLANNKETGEFHFWQTMFPQFAAAMAKQGVKVTSEYPAATGGWMPSLLAMVDRGTSLHPSFVEKIAGQGNFAWTADSVGGLLRSNARSVRSEIQSIGQELQKRLPPGKKIEGFALYKQYMDMADSAEKLGESILKMNDFGNAFAGRPPVAEAEQKTFVYYRKDNGDWYRVEKSGLLQKYEGQAWRIETVDSQLSAAQILMQKLIGYPPIDAAPPRTFPYLVRR